VAEFEEAREMLPELRSRMIVRLDPGRNDLDEIAGVPLVELAYGQGVMDAARELKSSHPGLVVMVRLPLDEKAADRVLELARERGPCRPP
jgi:hypothetical protein